MELSASSSREPIINKGRTNIPIGTKKETTDCIDKVTIRAFHQNRPEVYTNHRNKCSSYKNSDDINDSNDNRHHHHHHQSTKTATVKAVKPSTQNLQEAGEKKKNLTD
jgi:hypothetical protein